MEQNLNAFKTLIEKLEAWVEKLKFSDDLYEVEDNLETIEIVITDIEEKIEEIINEIEEKEEYSNQKQNIEKFNEYRNRFVITKNFYYKKKDEILTWHNQNIPKRKEQQQIVTFDSSIKAESNNSTNINDKAKKNGK